jgi:cell division protein FtsL
MLHKQQALAITTTTNTTTDLNRTITKGQARISDNKHNANDTSAYARVMKQLTTGSVE